MLTADFIAERNIKGAIFDMDGTLTDSMERWREIYAELEKILGVKLPETFLMRVNHLAMSARHKLIIDELSLAAEPDKVYAKWLEKALGFYRREFKTRPYMPQILDILQKCGVRCCIATASDKRCAEAFIESNNLQKYFSFAVGLDEVKRPKNYPDIYIEAARRLGVENTRCLVFEDSLTALKSARAGGFKVCAVQDNSSARDREEIIKISDITCGYGYD